MRPAVCLLAALAILTCCARETSRGPISEEELANIRTELAVQACRARLDSLAFELDGLVYEASIENGGTSVIDLLPDTLPVCPLSQQSYVIQETEAVVTVTCPSGHGFRTIVR